MFNLHKQCLINQGYQPLNLLGKGSFSSVFTVKDLKTNNLKAVKIIENQQLITASLSSNLENVDRNNKKQKLDRNQSILELRRKKLRDHKAGQKYFNREVIISKRLIQSYHPSIVKIFSINKTFLFTYIYMEHLSNGNLNDYLNKKGPLEPDDDQPKLWIFQLASALEYLHSIGVAHRDLKLQNIGLTERLNAKLIDFGFACKCIINKISQPSDEGDAKDVLRNGITESLMKPLNSSKTMSFLTKSMESNLVNLKSLDTQSSYLNSDKLFSNGRNVEKAIQFSMSQCGTPLYIPPEVIIADKCPYDPRKADIWSLGVTMFAIISYRYPFTKREYKVLYKQQLKRTWITKRIYTCFSEDAFDLIQCMLEPMPKKRYTASQVLQHDWLKKNLKNNSKRNKHLRSEHSNLLESSDHHRNDHSNEDKKINEITDLNKQINKIKLKEPCYTSNESENSETFSIVSYESKAVSQSILSTTSLTSQSCI